MIEIDSDTSMNNQTLTSDILPFEIGSESRTSTGSSLRTDNSSSGSERIIVDQNSILINSISDQPGPSTLLAKHHPAISSSSTSTYMTNSNFTPSRSIIHPSTSTSTSTPNIKAKIEPLLDKYGNIHICNSVCRRIATPGEKLKCGFISQPVSFYRDKAIYGNETPSKIRAMDSMRTRYTTDKLRPNVVWYHHNEYCEGYPCRGDIFYCSIVNRCFFKERCVKHYAMRSRERCIPYNDGIPLDTPSTSASTSHASVAAQVKPRLMPQSGNLIQQTEFTPRKRQISNDNNEINGFKRSRNGISPISGYGNQAGDHPLTGANYHPTPPSSSTSKTLIRINFAGKDNSDDSVIHHEQGLPTPSSGLDRSSSPRRISDPHVEGEDEIDPIGNGITHDDESSSSISTELSAEDEEIDDVDEDENNDEIAMMWKGMYTQTKGELDAVTVHLLQVQDDLAIEREKRFEAEKINKTFDKRVLSGNKKSSSNNENKNNKGIKEKERNDKEENSKYMALSVHLNQAQIEIQQLKDEVENLKKENITLEVDRDERINQIKSMRDLFLKTVG